MIEPFTESQLVEIAVHALGEIEQGCRKYSANHRHESTEIGKRVDGFMRAYHSVLDDIASENPVQFSGLLDDFKYLNELGIRHARHPENGSYFFLEATCGSLIFTGFIWPPLAALFGLAGVGIEYKRRKYNDEWKRQIELEDACVLSAGNEIWQKAFEKIYHDEGQKHD